MAAAALGSVAVSVPKPALVTAAAAAPAAGAGAGDDAKAKAAALADAKAKAAAVAVSTGSMVQRCTLAPAADPNTPERVIIDTDPGIDDALALFLALGSPELKIEALTLVMGNHSSQDLLAHNACAILQMAGVKPGTIPVVKGASHPLIGEYHGHSGILVHSENGFGGITPPLAKVDLSYILQPGAGAAAAAAPAAAVGTDAKAATTHAAAWMVQHVLSHPKQISICTLGPMTNLALAVKLGGAPFVSAVKRVVMMGGGFDGRGNKTPSAEANVHNDPHAAKLVFESFPDITMAPLNATRQVQLSQAFRDRLKVTGGKVGKFCHDITQHYVDLLQKWNAEHVLHDPTAIMAMVEPHHFLTEHVAVDVETTDGAITIGQTVADWRGHWKRLRPARATPQSHVIVKVVSEAAYHDAFLKRISKFQ